MLDLSNTVLTSCELTKHLMEKLPTKRTRVAEAHLFAKSRYIKILATPAGEQAPTNTPEASRGTDSTNSISFLVISVKIKIQCYYVI